MQMAKNGASRRVEVDVDAVTFGVEIECTLPSGYIQERGILIGAYHHGAQLPAPFPAGWTAQRDGSLEAGRGYKAVEIVSPVLKGMDGLREVLRVFEILNEAGVRVNPSCGFHVHVGVQSVLGAQASDEGIVVRWVRRMVHLVSVHELALFAITGQPGRPSSVYCRTIKGQWDGVLQTQSSLRTVTDHVSGHSDRYHTLNLCNLVGGKRTVEFRVFGATVDGVQALGYVVTAMGIAHRAAACGTAPGFDRDTLVDLAQAEDAVVTLQKALARYGWPTGAKAEWGRAIGQVQADAARRFAR